MLDRAQFQSLTYGSEFLSLAIDLLVFSANWKQHGRTGANLVAKLNLSAKALGSKPHSCSAIIKAGQTCEPIWARLNWVRNMETNI